MSRAEERALKYYPDDTGTLEGVKHILRVGFVKGYELAEKDIRAIVKEYLEKGLLCMEQDGESQIHTFWDGFHNCAENILRELEDEK